MIYDSSYDTAADGATVATVVELLMDESEPFARLPWRVTARVYGSRSFTAHRSTLAAARIVANRMHGAYLESHGGRKVDAFAEVS